MIRHLAVSHKDTQALRRLHKHISPLTKDTTSYVGTVVRKPWGYEYLAFENDNVAVWVLHIQHGARTSLHCHPHKKTSLIVLQGEARCTTLTQRVAVCCGHALAIGAGVFHATEACSPAGAVVMEIETPNNKKDLVRLKDFYGREGTQYEGKEHHVPLADLEYVDVSSFHDPETRYTTTQRIGDFEVALARYATTKEFAAFLEASPDYLVAVVRGSVGRGRVPALAHGDIELVSLLKKGRNLDIVSETEFLVLRSLPSHL